MKTPHPSPCLGALWLALTLTGCAGYGVADPQLSVALGESFTLQAGQEVAVDDGRLYIRLRGVSDDSRCPTDVTCVWAGDATVRLGVRLGRAMEQDREVHTTLDPKNIVFAEYRITLEALSPEPHSGTTISEDEYRARLRVERM